ncbi:MAG TPA: hypothetical protein ENK02_02090 [Planctomycetes bacterium]|nr:hypothetical protein [Planctomycetota bacterium]
MSWVFGSLTSLFSLVLGLSTPFTQGQVDMDAGFPLRLAKNFAKGFQGRERRIQEQKARKDLERWFQKRQFPLSPDPDALAVLPPSPLVLDGVPDLLEAVDLLRLKNRGERLPIRVEPGLALPNSWARKRPWFPGGSWWFEDLLPESPLPRNQLVRLVPRALILSRSKAVSSLAGFFARTFLLFIQPGLRKGVRDRAAIELAALGVLDWERHLLPLEKSRPDLKEALELFRAVSYALGDSRGMEGLPFEAWFHRFTQTRGAPALYLGLALRRALQLGELRLQIRPRRAGWAKILAGLPPGELAPKFESLLVEGLPPEVETCLVLALSREGGALSKRMTQLAMDRCFGVSKPPLGNKGNRRVAAWLLLLLRRNPEALRGRGSEVWAPDVCGEDLRRGRLFGRNLSRLGRKESLAILGALSRRMELSGGDLGLLSAMDSLGTPGLGLELPDLIQAYRAKETTPVGRVLLDLGIGEVRNPSLPARPTRAFLKKAFQRLLQYQASPLPKPKGWENALGKALGNLLVLLPQTSLGRSSSHWLASWVQDKKMHEVGMKAFEVAIKTRSSLFRDSLGRLDQGRTGRMEALRILRRWNRLALRNPLPSGGSLWFPLDPLLGERELEFDLPLNRR